MILSGDEFRNSQSGNNNAYCQDNSISWLNWEDLEKNRDTFEFFKKLIAFRKAHPVLRRKDFFTGVNSSGYPELSFHGTQAWQLDGSAPFHTFGFMYAETARDHGVKEDCFIYCGVNAYWEERELELPVIPDRMNWYKVAYTPELKYKNTKISGSRIRLAPRSLMLLIAK